jgi:hypothetical protein
MLSGNDAISGPVLAGRTNGTAAPHRPSGSSRRYVQSATWTKSASRQSLLQVGRIASGHSANSPDSCARRRRRWWFGLQCSRSRRPRATGQGIISDRRQTPLVIAGNRHLIGTLHRSWKLTEINAESATEISTAEDSLKSADLPAAAMVAEVVELPLLGVPESLVAARYAQHVSCSPANPRSAAAP